MNTNQNLLESVNSNNIIGFQKEIKEMLRVKLDEAIETQLTDIAPLAVNNIEPPLMNDAESEAVNQLRQTAKHLGGDEGTYFEGLFEVTIPDNGAASDFAAFLEACDSVESYEIEAVSADPFKEEGEEIESLDDFEDDENTCFEFCVFLNPDLVSYHPVEVELDGDEEFADDNGDLYEVKRLVKINFRGKRRIKMQCNPGFKWDPAARTCRKIGGSELATKRKALRVAVRTKKAKGASFRRRVLRKTRKALRFRKAFGLGN